ncbi:MULTISPECIES: preprotein translocase subunit SecA [unclassified Arcicella]|uniref:preprotein translocase subunit SecA n=1 Tax=unclassified Arcicella TaxID=2644986 RepID=UPI00285DB976|nr:MULTISPECIES: preprotein translocase subunit SecA [unclassified Arcicella]MDR6561085.1 preprotein translocase subunit SecA [Arcicella sp. BE51]MDR6810969.1 preprotein translocase subunit SecA [Arcicella sp. BE140]MDR6822319.1 preprotein translocase subunit SecA [Arcicella sp. BE139]
MINSITKAVTKLFGTKSERDIKELMPYVIKTNAEFATLRNLSDEQLRQQTADLKAIIQKNLAKIDAEISDLKLEVEANQEMSVDAKETIFNQIDKLQLDRDKQLEVVLLEILPKAFAVVKETARRFTENKKLEVTATVHDKFIAAKKKNVEIVGEKAIWHNKWLAAGNEIEWNMIHYDVQLIGGVVLHQGKIAEMATGEGKTLVSTLPCYLNALAGQGVHLVTVNDYLAKRDSEWNAPLFEFHGLKVDCIDKHDPNTEERRQAYLADITYGTNNEFGFDYLRDNMSRTPEEQVQRKHHFAMVDEVDSVLIDDARTPLIISGPMARGDEQEFDAFNPLVARMVEQQKKLVQDFLVEAKKLIAAGNKKEGGLALFRAFRGLPKSRPVIKYLSETGIKQILQETENIYLAENQKLMPEADAPLMFTIEEKNNQVEMTEKGLNFMTRMVENPDFFVIPDLSVDLNQIEQAVGITEQERLIKKEALIRDYSAKTQRIHTVSQLLKAFTLFEKDVEYVLDEGKVKIVDESTGRIMEGRRYSDGLHQAIEAKEGVNIEDATQTYATITLQNFFRMYHKLCGMTGTAETEAGEFWTIYKLDVVTIPTNRKISRFDHEDKVYKTVREKYNAVADEIQELVNAGRPVLVGTTSVDNSELLSRMLTIRKIQHNVLNAKQHAREADIVAEAGQASKVTIATNMAGRGTDIKLSPEARAAGGLAIVGTERHESRRVDRQLRGRAGRQGDVGSSQFFLSLEDDLMRKFGSDRIAKVMDRMGMEEGEVIQHSMITSSVERAQKKVEENNFGIRKRLLEYDDVMNYQRNAIYKRRQNALFGERLALDIANNTYDVCSEIIQNNISYDELELRCIEILGIEPPFTREEIGRLNTQQRTTRLYDAAEKHYHTKNKGLAEKVVAFAKEAITHGYAGMQVPLVSGSMMSQLFADAQETIDTNGRKLIQEMEKSIALSLIDQEWKEHLRDMDDLKQSVQNASYEQKDPLLVYKFEAVKLFERFLSRINLDTVSFLMKADMPEVQEAEAPAPQRRQAPQPKLQVQKDEAISSLLGGLAGGRGDENDYHDPSTQVVEKVAPRQAVKIADRNQRVTVQYRDGSIKENIKYKTVEQDVEKGIAVVIA